MDQLELDDWVLSANKDEVRDWLSAFALRSLGAVFKDRILDSSLT